MNPNQATILKQTPPKYPDQDRASHTEGKVSMYALIGNDGIPGGLRIVAGATAGMNSASLDAVRQGRYAPPTCNDHVAEIETIISVNYKMR
jgi:outer membrane biosynthesis protein TonB